MSYKGYKSKKIIKKINWLLNSVNLSLELLKDIKWKKVYALLKKAQKYLEIDKIDKKELKVISKAIANGALSKSDVSLIAKTWFKLEKKSTLINKFKNIFYKEPFLGTFFDEKQIFLC